jgi:hypothetical protein
MIMIPDKYQRLHTLAHTDVLHRVYRNGIIDILAEVKRLREENEKQHNVLTTLDEMIQRGESHIEMMKVLEQGLGLPETWKEMIE